MATPDRQGGEGGDDRWREEVGRKEDGMKEGWRGDGMKEGWRGDGMKEGWRGEGRKEGVDEVE